MVILERSSQRTKSGVMSVIWGFSSLLQGRRRVLESGTAIERHRRSARAEGTSRGRAREGDFSPVRKGGSGDLPREIF